MLFTGLLSQLRKKCFGRTAPRRPGRYRFHGFEELESRILLAGDLYSLNSWLIGQPGTDINVTRHAGDQSETAIAVNPVNPNNMIIAVNDLAPTDGIFGQHSSNDHVYVTINGGVNWTRVPIPLPAAAPNPDSSHGDPTVVFSRDGSRAVFVHMADKFPPDHGGDDGDNIDDERHVMVSAVSRADGSNNAGLTWLQADTDVIGSFAVDEDGGPNPNDKFPDDNDKEFLAVGPDKEDSTRDRFVVTWQRNGVIYASTGVLSAVDGIDWGRPVRVGGLTGGSSTVAPSGDSIDAIPSFGPKGEIYVVWEEFGTAGVSHVMFDVSLDGGLTWGGDRDATVLFDTGSSTLDSGDMLILDDVAAALKSNPHLIATVAGYTDTVGWGTSNQTLSDKRAKAVFDYLTLTRGVAASQLKVLGFGETHLAVPTDDNIDKPLNRRVEVTFDQVIYTGNVNVFKDFANRAVISGAINSATQANPVVITTPQPHGLMTGDTVEIADVVGMLELNGQNFNVTVISPTSFSLDNENGTGHTAYASGGTWSLVNPYTVPAQPDRGIWMGLSIDVDRSGGSKDGRIYVAFVDQADLDGDNDYGNAVDHDDTDVFVIASDDSGSTWSALGSSPAAVGTDQVKVNDDGGTATQFFSWLAVDQSTGNVAISWYDARNDDGLLGAGDTDGISNNDVQYFAAISFDSGRTWSKNIQVSDGTSTAAGTLGGDYGDYTGLAFVNNTVHMTWADTSNSTGPQPLGHNPDGAGSFPDTYYDRIQVTNPNVLSGHAIRSATVITHGYQNSLLGSGDSLMSLAQAIQTRVQADNNFAHQQGAPQVPVVLLDYDVVDLGPHVEGRFHFPGGLPSLPQGAAVDLIVLFDWARESDEESPGWGSVLPTSVSPNGCRAARTVSDRTMILFAELLALMAMGAE